MCYRYGFHFIGWSWLMPRALLYLELSVRVSNSVSVWGQPENDSACNNFWGFKVFVVLHHWNRGISQKGILWKKAGLWFRSFPVTEWSSPGLRDLPFESSVEIDTAVKCSCFDKSSIFWSQKYFAENCSKQLPSEWLWSTLVNCFNSSQFSNAANYLWCRFCSYRQSSLFLPLEWHQELSHYQEKNLLSHYSIKWYKWNSGDNCSSSIAMHLLIISARLKIFN